MSYRLFYLDGDNTFFTSLRELRMHFDNFLTQKERESFVGEFICSYHALDFGGESRIHGYVSMNKKNRLVVKRLRK